MTDGTDDDGAAGGGLRRHRCVQGVREDAAVPASVCSTLGVFEPQSGYPPPAAMTITADFAAVVIRPASTFSAISSVARTRT